MKNQTVIEIGVPFSDPIAESPVVQEANVRALSAEGGCTTDMIFNMLASIKDKVTVPIVLMSYLNPAPLLPKATQWVNGMMLWYSCR